MTRPNHQNQHFVPQFLLRNFTDSKGYLYVFDKAKRRHFRTKPRNIAAEFGFYDFHVDGELKSFEPFLTQVEGDASIVINETIAQQTLADLTVKARVKLSMFIAIQILRVRGTRERMISLSNNLHREILARGIDPNGFVKPLDEEAAKIESIEQCITLSQEIGEAIASRPWMLHKSPKGSHFVLSDNPVTQFHVASNRRGIGVKTPGVEIYLPISPDLSICVLCNSWLDEFQRALALEKHFTSRNERRPLDLSPIKEQIQLIKSGEPCMLMTDNVTHQNSLQVLSSSRFVISIDEDFSLVRSMVDINPELGKPPEIVCQ